MINFWDVAIIAASCAASVYCVFGLGMFVLIGRYLHAKTIEVDLQRGEHEKRQVPGE
jgi:hypothetical protein